MRWQREDWKKDSEWTKKNGDWESEDVSGIKKPIHTFEVFTVKRIFYDLAS